MLKDNTKDNIHSFADLLQQDEEFQLLTILNEEETNTLYISYNEIAKHPVLYKHN